MKLILTTLTIYKEAWKSDPVEQGAWALLAFTLAAFFISDPIVWGWITG